MAADPNAAQQKLDDATKKQSETAVNAVQAPTRGCGLGGPSDSAKNCKDAADEADEKKVDPGDIIAAINSVTDFINGINNTLSCEKLKAELNIAEDALKQQLDGFKRKVKKIVDEIIPQGTIPLPLPSSIIKWVKRKILGDVIPFIKAMIQIMKAIIALLKAIQALIQLLETLIPRLEACIKAIIDEQLACAGIPLTSNDILSTAKGDKTSLNRAKKQIFKGIEAKAKRKIAGAIADALCDGGIVGDINEIKEAISTTKDLIGEIKSTVADVKSAVQTNLNEFGTQAAKISEGTGVPMNFDTSSPEAFVTSAESGAQAEMETSANTLFTMAPPTNATLPSTSGNAVVGSTLSVNVGTWNGPNIEYSYAWFKGDEPIWAANTGTLVLTSNEQGYAVKCQVFASNPVGDNWANTPATAVVVSSPPVATVGPEITGNATLNSTLTANAGIWEGTPTITYQWQWAHISANIYGANASTYVIAQEDVGHSLTCIVTGTSNSGVNQQRATPTAIVTGNTTMIGTLSVNNLTVTNINAASVTASGNVTADYVLATTDVWANTDGTTVKVVRHYHSGTSSGNGPITY